MKDIIGPYKRLEHAMAEQALQEFLDRPKASITVYPPSKMPICQPNLAGPRDSLTYKGNLLTLAELIKLILNERAKA